MFKKTLLALAATAALASAVPAQAASFYLTIPISSRGTAPIANVEVTLANGTLANAMVGEPYSATVKNHLAVTGDEAFNFNRVGWGVSTGAIPAGLNFNVTTGAITGTPTAPGANTFGITATYRGKAAEGMFNLSVMEILLALQNKTLPPGLIGAPYSAELRNFLTVTGDQAFNGSNVGWSFTSGNLPAGLELNATTGEISGIPTGPSSAPFVVSASYRGTAASGNYSLSVLDITVNLAATTLPEAVVNEAYSANLAANLAVANDASFTPGTAQVNWALSGGTLPAGLTLSAAGLVAGTPSATTTGAEFQVKASYKGREGQQTYTIVVGGVAFEVSQLSAGYNHTCAVTPSAGVMCWGQNNYGQLGDGTKTVRQIPTQVSGLTSGVKSVSAGYNHSCAAMIDGSVKCWGQGGLGQLGDGAGLERLSPVSVTNLGAAKIAVIRAGANHTCGISKAGALICWGLNNVGQLGNPAVATAYVPEVVPGMGSGVTSLGGSHVHTCAVQNGGLKCWGYNDRGQIGSGNTAQQNTPFQVFPAGSGVSSVSAGAAHTCAIISGGLQCWGNNSNGQLGRGTPANEKIPGAVLSISSVTSVAVGSEHTCAVAAGAGYCWGRNNFAQLGLGSFVDTNTPHQVSGAASGITNISAGAIHSCGTFSGVMKCWGGNGHGQLGTGGTAAAINPQPVSN